jgi:hypothetical protein
MQSAQVPSLPIPAGTGLTQGGSHQPREKGAASRQGDAYEHLDPRRRLQGDGYKQYEYPKSRHGRGRDETSERPADLWAHRSVISVPGQRFLLKSLVRWSISSL